MLRAAFIRVNRAVRTTALVMVLVDEYLVQRKLAEAAQSASLVLLEWTTS
jgi:hypothetical protein